MYIVCMQSLTRVLWARGKLWLFCVEAVYLGTAQTRTFWAKGIVCLFCLRLVGLATSMQSALSKGNSVSFLCRIVWFHYFASFVSHWWIWVRVRRKPSGPMLWAKGILCVFCGEADTLGTDQTRTFWAKGIQSLFCLGLIGLGTSMQSALSKGNIARFLCRTGWFQYCAFFVSPWLVCVRVRRKPSGQRVWLFCVELISLGTGRTRTFWAKGILCLFCLGLVGLVTSLCRVLWAKGILCLFCVQ